MQKDALPQTRPAPSQSKGGWAGVRNARQLLHAVVPIQNAFQTARTTRLVQDLELPLWACRASEQTPETVTWGRGLGYKVGALHSWRTERKKDSPRPRTPQTQVGDGEHPCRKQGYLPKYMPHPKRMMRVS